MAGCSLTSRRPRPIAVLWLFIGSRKRSTLSRPAISVMVPDFFVEFLLSIRLLPISSVSPMGTWCWDQEVSQLPDVSALNVTDRQFVKSTSVLEVQLGLCECFPWAVSPDTNSRQNTLHRLEKHSICRLGLKSHLSVLKLQTLLLF